MSKTFVFFVTFIFLSSYIFSQPIGLKEIVKLKTTGIRDQQEIGSCWAFGTISMLESDLLNQKNLKVDLSENFILYYTYLNRGKMYLMMNGNISFGEGGQAHDVMNVISENGIVPESVYPYNLSSHSTMVHELKSYLDSLNKFDTILLDWKTKYIEILDRYLGKPPKEFVVDGKTYTPHTYRNYLEINPNNYIEITSFTHREMYKKFVLEVPDNWSMGLYLNVPISKILEIVDFALEQNYSLVWDGDVSTKGFDYKESIALFTENFQAKYSQIKDQEYRQILFLKKITTDDHLMNIVGIYKSPDNVKYYLAKNSWGETGKANGFVYLSDKFIVFQTIAIMVNKNALKPELKMLLNVE